MLVQLQYAVIHSSVGFGRVMTVRMERCVCCAAHADVLCGSSVVAC